MMAKKSAPTRAAPAPAPTTDAGGKRPIVTTTFRLYRDQLIALQREAFEQRASGTAGRADASAIIREVLDEYLRRRKR